jgi:hypothetical protein
MVFFYENGPFFAIFFFDFSRKIGFLTLCDSEKTSNNDNDNCLNCVLCFGFCFIFSQVCRSNFRVKRADMKNIYFEEHQKRFYIDMFF